MFCPGDRGKVGRGEAGVGAGGEGAVQKGGGQRWGGSWGEGGRRQPSRHERVELFCEPTARKRQNKIFL